MFSPLSPIEIAGEIGGKVRELTTGVPSAARAAGALRMGDYTRRVRSLYPEEFPTETTAEETHPPPAPDQSTADLEELLTAVVCALGREKDDDQPAHYA